MNATTDDEWKRDILGAEQRLTLRRDVVIPDCKVREIYDTVYGVADGIFNRDGYVRSVRGNQFLAVVGRDPEVRRTSIKQDSKSCKTG